MSSSNPRPDFTKTAAVMAIRESTGRLTGSDLRRLREKLFELQLSFIERMIEGGTEPAFVAGLADATAALAAVERLARER